MLKKCKCKSVTLLELLISLVVLAIIVMGFTSIEVFSRYQLLSSDRRSAMQNEVSRSIEHISKQLINAIGRIDDPAVVIYPDNRGFRVRIDDNPANGQIDGTDTWKAYRHGPIGTSPAEEQLIFYSAAGTSFPPVGSAEVISNKIRIANSGARFTYNPTNNFIDVEIIACWDPSESLYPCGFSDNVSVRMRSRIKMPAASTN